jgi:hypothetical protein
MLPSNNHGRGGGPRKLGLDREWSEPWGEVRGSGPGYDSQPEPDS